MKRVFLICVALLAGSAFAQSGGMKGMDMKMDKKDAKRTVHKATGVVTRVDKDKVTIKHVPMKKDQKVDFEFVQEGSDHVVTAVK